MGGNFFLIFSSIIIGIGFIEASLRLTSISFPVFHDYDHRRAVRLRPGANGWYRKEGNAYITINSLGYRDIEHEVEKPGDVFRIAVLGDSFVEARQVSIEDTFWKRLERQLQNCPGLPSRKIEVLSFGVGGYGTAQELMTLQLHALGFAPDFVLLAFTIANDFINNTRELAAPISGDDFRPYYLVRDGELVLDDSFRDLSLTNLYRRFSLTAIHYSRTLEIINKVRRNLAVRRLQETTRYTGESELGLRDEVFLPPANEAWNKAWIITEALIQRMAQEAASAGAEFTLATIPAAIQVHPDAARRRAFAERLGVEDLSYPDRHLQSLGRRLGFPVVSLTERMQDLSERTGTYLHGFENTALGRGHWNEEGHRVTADILTDDLCGSGLLR